MGWKIEDFPLHMRPKILDAMVQQSKRQLGKPPKILHTKRKPQVKRKGVQNNLEKDFYATYLLPRIKSGELSDIAYESRTFNLAHRCTYTPDFSGGLTNIGKNVHFEVKGQHRFKEKGILKLKFAARCFMIQDFFLCEKKKGKWVVKLIPSK